jgi:hypothetical protein
MRKQLDREIVIKRLHETRSKLRTAETFQISKEVLREHLDKWGVVIDFREALPFSHSSLPLFSVGQVVIWQPLKARQRCYGHDIAWAPVAAKIIRGRDKGGHYYIEITDKMARRMLVKSHYTVHENALKQST